MREIPSNIHYRSDFPPEFKFTDEDESFYEFIRHIEKPSLLTAEEEKSLAKAYGRGLVCNLITSRLDERDDQDAILKELSEIKSEVSKEMEELKSCPKGKKQTRDSYLREQLRLLDWINEFTAEVERKKFTASDIKVFAGEQKTARDALTLHNLGLIGMVVEWYKERVSKFSASDLFQEGYLGLIRAIERYDYRLQVRFSSYATDWIRSSISKAINDHGYSVDLPINVRLNMGKIRKAEDSLAQNGNIDPSDEELASEVDLPSSKIKEIRSNSLVALSLDSSPWEDGTSDWDFDDSYESYLAPVSPDEDNPEYALDEAEQQALLRKLKSYLALLTEEEQMLISLTYEKGLSSYAISVETKIPRSTLVYRLAAVRKKLKGLMTDRLPSPQST